MHTATRASGQALAVPYIVAVIACLHSAIVRPSRDQRASLVERHADDAVRMPAELVLDRTIHCTEHIAHIVAGSSCVEAAIG